MPRFHAPAVKLLRFFLIPALAFPAILGAEAPAPPLSADQAAVLEAARIYALAYTQNLPNFICTQFTQRQVSANTDGDTSMSAIRAGRGAQPIRPEAPTIDTLTEMLTYINREEHYDLVSINGKKVSGASRQKLQGALSSGEFGTALYDIFAPRSHAVFTWERKASLRGRKVYIFAFQVPKEAGITVEHEDPDVKIVASYSGQLFVDAQTKEVLRMTSHLDLPQTFPIKLAERTVDYMSAIIEGKTYNLPSSSELRMADSLYVYANKIDFKNYHKFTVESTIRLGSFAGPPLPAAPPDAGLAATMPAGAERASESVPPELPLVSEASATASSGQPQSPSPAPIENTASLPAPPQPAVSTPAVQSASARNPSASVAAEQPATTLQAAVQPPPSPAPNPNPPSMPGVSSDIASDSPYRLRVGVDLVMVPVVVRDRNGQAVGTLTRDDFQVFDKGKRQEISTFTVESQPSPAGDLSSATPAAAAPQPSAAAGPRRGFVVYLFDDVHLKFSDLAMVRAAAARHMDTLKPTEWAAILTTSGIVSSPFTTDRALLKETLLKLRAQPLGSVSSAKQCPDLSYFMADQMLNQSPNLESNQPLEVAFEETRTCMNISEQEAQRPQVAQMIMNSALSAARRVQAQGDQENRGALLALRDVVRWLAKAPGYRNLVLVSPGFTVSGNILFDESNVVDEAIRNQVVINALDARGLYVLNPAGDIEAASAVSPEVMQISSQLERQEASDDAGVMQEMAAGTGGAFIHNTNDFDGSFARLATPPAFVYLLGFKPAKLKLDGSVHPLKVKLTSKNGKLDLQARLGYVATKQ